MRRDMSAALRTSLKQEEKTTSDRFERAEALFKIVEPLPSPEPAPESSRVVRDSFTMPAQEYEQIAALRERCLKSQISVNKSEILRAGLAALAAMSDGELALALQSLAKVKTGRPIHSV